MTTTTMTFDKQLEVAGLTRKDLDVHVITPGEQMALGLRVQTEEGLIVPYRDIQGNLIDFYVGKVNTPTGPKTVQPRSSLNHLYFPKYFQGAFNSHRRARASAQVANGPGYLGTYSGPIVICAGEVEATALCKMGIAACSYKPIYGWRNSGIRVPKESEVVDSQYQEGMQYFLDIELPPGFDAQDILVSLAKGADSLLRLTTEANNETETKTTVSGIVLCGPKFHEAQESLAMFFWELQNHGVQRRDRDQDHS